jgi:hypothetical protein
LAVWRQHLIVVLRVLNKPQRKLLGVGKAGGLPGFRTSLSKDREKYCCKDRDNSDHNEQFDQGKSSTAVRWSSL